MKVFNSLNTKCVYACMPITTITPFMHDLDIACKNVLISHNFMMHANACCTCNHIMFPPTLAKEPHYSDDLT